MPKYQCSKCGHVMSEPLHKCPSCGVMLILKPEPPPQKSFLETTPMVGSELGFKAAMVFTALFASAIIIMILVNILKALFPAMANPNNPAVTFYGLMTAAATFGLTFLIYKRMMKRINKS